MQLAPRTQRPKPFIQRSLPWIKAPLSLNDIATLVAVGCIASYLMIARPPILLAACFGALIALNFNVVQRGLMAAGCYFSIRFWHLAALVCGSTVFLDSLNSPAQAQFFNTLEEAIADVITEADTGIDEGIITTIFVFFRVLIVLAFLVGVVVVFTQATRGNDWQPIANLLAIGIAFVIGVEVITVLILGDAGAGGG